MLTDSLDRKFSYLRLSVTEKCNFRCLYCLPNGYKNQIPGGSQFLAPNEIRHLAAAFKELGVRKIRLTGGEPTLRADIVDIVRILKSEVGIEEVALTTNAFSLSRLLPPLKEAGLDAINVSLDSLWPPSFKNICGADRGLEIRKALDFAREIQIKKIKINSVLLKGLNDHEVDDFVEYVRDRDVTVRFIELMRTGENKEFFEGRHLALAPVERKLIEAGWGKLPSTKTSGPAGEYQHRDFLGRIGFISPYARDFCQGCNRLRVSARGRLRLCLFGEGEVSLREHLQTKDGRGALKDLVLESLRLKAPRHRLHENIYGLSHSLSSIGG